MKTRQEGFGMGDIASVVLSSSTREFDREYHYIIPESLKNAVIPGVRVIVPFGRANRYVEAYVLDVVNDTEFTELKEIKKVVDENPVMGKHMIELARWMKDKYICTYSDAIKCMLPPGIGIKSFCMVKLVKQSSDVDKNQRIILDLLAESNGECELEELESRANMRSFRKQLNSLEKAGLITICEEYTSRVKEKKVRAASLAVPREEVIEDIENGRIKRIQQIRVLELLLDNEYISVPDILRFSGVTAGVLDTLRKYGYIFYKDIIVNRDPMENKHIEYTQPFSPTAQQAEVLEAVKSKLDMGIFAEVLLHGVTGSGKTEVYMQLIEHCIQLGRQAIVLVPEISLTPQTVERFKSRFGKDVAVQHSRLSLGERYDQWRLIKDGGIKVVVGTRSAVFAPLDKLGLIVIDEEHENSYKSEITPKYHAREIAKKRCALENAVLLYGSATPSIETYFRAKCGEMEFLEMNTRANNMLLPTVEIVDMRGELNEGNRSIFSRKLAEEIRRNIENQQQTLLFLNRRGHASFVLCRNCGYTLKCLNCSVSMTYHSHEERLICHYCGYTVKNPSVCPKCGSSYIRHFGAGTQRVEEEIKNQFPGCSVIRMDADTTAHKNSHEEILKTFREKNINIMVGTQMIAKGHDFPNVTLVGVLAADSMLNSGDYNSSERTFQLITQVAGRAGRGRIPGKVIIQTYNTEDFSILAACKHDYKSFYHQEIMMRRALNYPPFTNISALILSGTNDRLTFSKAKELKGLIEKLATAGDDVEVLGPARAPLMKIKSKYRWRIVIKQKDLSKLTSLLREISDIFYGKKQNKGVDLNIDINPVNML